MNDDMLLQETGRGSRKAFRTLFDSYAPRLLRFVQKMVGVRPEGEELLQDIMLRIWIKAPLFDPARGKASTWMFLVARRTILNWLASPNGGRSRHEAGSEVDIESLVSSGEPGPEQTVIRREEAGLALRGLEKIPQDLREALVLRFIEGLSLAEVAQIIECPEGTVKSRIFYGLKKLRDILKQEASHAPQPS